MIIFIQNRMLNVYDSELLAVTNRTNRIDSFLLKIDPLTMQFSNIFRIDSNLSIVMDWNVYETNISFSQI